MSLAAALMACGESEDPPAVADLEFVEPAIHVLELRNSRPVELQDTLALHFVHDLKIRGDWVAVIDGEDRVVMLDRNLVPERVLGRSGSGPGELRRPGAIQFWHDGILVADHGNGRALFWSTDGVERWTHPLSVSHGSSLTATESGALVFPITSGRNYVGVIETSGAEREWARRPVRRQGDRGVPEEVVQHISVRDFAVITAGDTLHVLDGMRAEFLKYAPNGRLVEYRRLPPALRERVLAGKGVTVAEHPGGGSVSFWAAFADFEVSEDGALLAVLNPGELLGSLKGFLIEAGSYRAREIHADPGIWPGQKVAAALDRRGLVVATFEGGLFDFIVGVRE